MSDDLRALVLAQVQNELGFESVGWCDGPPDVRAHGGRSVAMRAIYPLLRLVPGVWLRVGPASSGSYHAEARKNGMEAVVRREPDGRQFLYLRAPEASA